ncbi:MAG: permease [Candidatus Dormibacteraceae bacterium]
MTQVVNAIATSLEMGFFMFWDTLWPLILGFGLSGAVQAFASRSQMQRLMGDHSLRSLARASFFGMISSSCSYAASAMSKSLFQKGADFTTAMVFMLASTNLVLELGLVLWILIGWQFTISEYVGGIVMIGLLSLIARFFFKPRLVEAAYQRLNARAAAVTGHDHNGETADQTPVPVRQRVTSAAGWADAASYTMADLTMLRKELLLGYLVAGFLAVLVPTSVWNVLFFRGHSVWTSVENVIVGPLIAVISFVCSIGNVPLAAALWTGGISFGGVISFVFADLITLPLILIYRKFYGWALTWRLVAAFWIVMSLAGLITELIFGALGQVPQVRPAHPVPIGFQWNYTTVLNLVFLVVFAVLYWLYRNRARFGGGGKYAIDPVCGMQVEMALAPAKATFHDQPVYFCSDHCQDRFMSDPERFAKGGGQPAVAPINGQGQPASGDPDASLESAVDAVCGMSVEKAKAAAVQEHEGFAYYFCSKGCAERFARDPSEFVTVESGTAVDPVCGMTVEKTGAKHVAEHEGEKYYFCAPGCQSKFGRDPETYAVSGRDKRGHASER